MQADLCLLVVNGWRDDTTMQFYEELVVGCCHMMSSREVIVAINLQRDNNAEKSKFYC